MADGSFEVSPGLFMTATCHHRRSGAGACGPCYARLYKALERVEAAPTVEAVRAICAETSAAMVAEAPQRREAAHG